MGHIFLFLHMARILGRVLDVLNFTLLSFQILFLPEKGNGLHYIKPSFLFRIESFSDLRVACSLGRILILLRHEPSEISKSPRLQPSLNSENCFCCCCCYCCCSPRLTEFHPKHPQLLFINRLKGTISHPASKISGAISLPTFFYSLILWFTNISYVGLLKLTPVFSAQQVHCAVFELPFLHHCPESISRQKAKVITGLISFVSLLSRIIVLTRLLSDI